MTPILRSLLLPLLVVAGLLVVRPGVVLNGLRSPVAWLAVTGVVLAGWLARWSVRRAGGSALGQQLAGSALVLALGVGLLAPSFRQRTLVEDFPEVAATGPVATATAPSPAAASDPPATASGAPSSVPSAAAPPGPSSVAPAPASSAPASKPAPRPSSAAPVAAPAPSSAAPAPAPSRATAQRLTSGDLKGIGHTADGRTGLYLVDGRGVLRFEDVNIEGTVDPSVHLVPRGKRTPSGGIRLGALKAEKGSFSYTLPAGTDLARDWTVLVWCDPYDTPIGASDHS